MTRPAFTRLEKACLILPAEQKWAFSARLAAARLLPFTFGTTQFLSVNFAVAESGPWTLSLHLERPWHAPDQPAKAEPLAAFTFRVTDLPKANPCEHFFGQLIPFGELVILPEPLPLL